MRNARTTAIGLAMALAVTTARAGEPSRGVAYVSNQNAGVSVIDLARLETIATIDNGSATPRGLGISDDGRWLVTANRDAGDLSIIDRAEGKVVRKVAIGTNPEFVRVRGNLAFVSYEPSSKGGPPGAHEEDDDDDAKQEPAQVAVVDIAQGTVLRRILGGLETEGLEFSADGRHLLVTNEADDTITVHDIATGRLVRTIPTIAHGKRPRGIKRSPDGKTYVATLEFGNQLLILDAKYEVVKSVPTADFPYGLAFDRQGAKLYVAAARAKVLQVFDAKTWAPLGSAPTGDRCWHFTFTPDDAQLLVVCGRSNEVVVLDAGTLAPVKRIEDKQLPWGAVTWPKSMGSLDLPAS